MANTGWANSSRALNELLREIAEARGLPWTCDIVAKKNAPNLMYSEKGVYKEFESEYERLRPHLRLPAAT